MNLLAIYLPTVVSASIVLNLFFFENSIIDATTNEQFACSCVTVKMQNNLIC